MEFLNDFLEQEAPRMKEFLHQISTRSEQPPTETILDWAGYIDQGKQLSILHNLLAESVQKLQTGRQNDLGQLHGILEAITKAKESSSFVTQQQQHLHQNQENTPQNGVKIADRGVIRGVLTPSSLERNIFRYNDPTVSPLLNQQNPFNQSQTSINGSIYSNHNLQHSHSTSSISSNTNSNHYHNNHHHQQQNQLMPAAVHNNNNNHHHYVTSQQQLQQQSQMSGSDQHRSTDHKSNVYLEPRNYNTTSHYYTNADRRSPAVRANTLPRNNNNLNSATIGNQVSNIEVHHSGDVSEKNSNLIQIGLETSNAFVRKSPTPMPKLSHSRSRNLNGSQLSLLSDRTTGSNKNAFNLNLNLGIPHTELNNQTAHSNMPMNLEDLDDLLKYAEEHAQDHQNSKPKELLTTKGSNVSIGVCSSGYQTTTQSQSSSPVELGVTTPPPLSAGHQQLDFSTKNHSMSRRLPSHHHHPIGSSSEVVNAPPTITCHINGKFAAMNNNVPPLAFKNPLYQMQNGSRHVVRSHKSSSLTPSSSEERLSNDNFCTSSSLVANGAIPISHLDLVTPNGGSGSDKSHGTAGSHFAATKRISTNNRLPRTNPMMQVSITDSQHI